MYKYSMILLSTTLLFLSGCGESDKSSTQQMKKSTTKQTTINQLAIKSINTPPIAKTQKSTTDKNTPTPTSITLKSNTTTLNIGEKAKLNITATYQDNTTKPINKGVTYIITPKDHAKINKGELTALKDGNLTIQAKVGNTLSNKLTLNIYWEVDGYRLPPEPDPKINNATLLGIDSNHNGVRDDVERWIYKKYKEYIPCHQELDYNNTAIIDGEVVPSAVKVCAKNPIPYHPVVRVAVMEIAKQAQIIIQNPKNARITDINFTKAYGCASVISEMKDKNNRKISDVDLSGEDFDAIQFNTAQRARAYAKYNYYLSGGVYELPTDEEILKGCSDEVKALLKDLK